MATTTNRDDALRAVAALPKGSTILLLGATDTGKTTFAHDAVRNAVRETGRTVALVDADIGQSEAGIPGIVASAIAGPRDAALPVRDWPTCDAAFVGATSPPMRVPAWIAAVSACVRDCLRAGAERVVIDTPGWVSGLAASDAYAALMMSVPPDLVLVFERQAEPNPLLKLFEGRAAPPVVARIVAGIETGRKARATRTARRAARLGTYFRDARTHTIPWEQTGFLGAHFAGAPSMAAHLLKFIGDVLGAGCLYASTLPENAIHAIIDGDPVSSARHFSPLTEHFGVRSVVVTPARNYQLLLCGLLDSSGRFLDAGLLQDIDFRANRVTVLTPLRHSSPVTQITFGMLRARPDGKELGELRTGTY
ncbi:MAG: Clp1/GlmU family protein [Capsulimonadaceae bacterium]|nr:Clp1/GlmU family protein [Capsulimonadaceae bacterium]